MQLRHECHIAPAYNPVIESHRSFLSGQGCCSRFQKLSGSNPCLNTFPKFSDILGSRAQTGQV